MCLSEIAVIIGSDGRTVPLSEPGTVVVYCRLRGTWIMERRLPFALEEDGGLAGLRKQMAKLTACLGACRTIVAQSAGGAVFFELEKAGCLVYEIPGSPSEFLDEVWQEAKVEQEEKAPLPASADIPAPIEIAPGRYYISICEIQKNRPEVSSKQVLRPFVQQGSFFELEIICDHVPPWIEMEAERLGYEIASERTGPHDLRVLLRRPAGGCC
ncbi:MAG: Fe-only nitrogenase accessory AnfO family protein [Methanoregula sp.]